MSDSRMLDETSELPLTPPPKPLGPPRRFEITLDGKSHAVMIKPTRGPAAPPKPVWVPGLFEIQGTSLREDELREHAHDDGPRELVVNSRGQISRPGENQAREIQSIYSGGEIGEVVPTYKGGNVISRERLDYLVSTGRLKKPDNMVNSFRPGRLRRRRKPFPMDNQYEAAALVNPGAYHGIAMSNRPLSMNGAVLAKGIALGHLVIGEDCCVYRKTRDVSGASVFKKIGKVAKGAGKGITKGAKAVGKGTVKLGKLTAKGALELTRLIASGAATPIRFAFQRMVGRPRANVVAHSHGRKSPNHQDKKEATTWALQKVKHGLPKPLGFMAYKILTFTRGVPLAGMGGGAPSGITNRILMGADSDELEQLATIGAALIDDVTYWSGAIITAIGVLKTTLSFTADLVPKRPGAPAGETPPGVTPGENPTGTPGDMPANTSPGDTTPTQNYEPLPPTAEQPSVEEPEQPEQEATSSGWLSFRPYP